MQQGKQMLVRGAEETCLYICRQGVSDAALSRTCAVES